MKRRNERAGYDEGSCFFVPLREGGFARGVVARLDGNGIVFAYFFGPKLRTKDAGFEELESRDAALVGFVGDSGFLNGEWPLAGAIASWSRGQWPLPPFYREDTKAERAWLSYYDEDTLECVREEPTVFGQNKDYPYDRLMGYVAAEIRLTKLLS